MAQYRFSTFAFITAISVGATSFGAEVNAARPNIVIILADDLGYSDPGCYGGEIQTPNIDRLARNGLRFTQFYNCGRCCPTRASLLTGLYPHQAGIGGMTFDWGTPGYQGELAENTATIAEVLSDAGYRTLMAGKWHLSLTKDSPKNALWVSHRLDLGRFSNPDSYPVGRGFDEHYGTIWGVVDYFDPFSLVHNREPIETVPEDYYYTDALSQNAVRMIRESASAAKTGEQPFFLYLAYTAPHWPLHAPEEEIKKYEDTYTAGWNSIRRARYERLIESGLFNKKSAPLPAPVEGPSWDEEQYKQWEARAMAVHAAMVTRMDSGIGHVLEELKHQGLRENTLVLFLSDNGASPERIGKPGFDRPSHLRDGTPVVYARRPDDSTPLPGPENTSFGIGPRWANVANAPFRYWKATTYEGGICTPCIACWPGEIEPGVTDRVGHVIDIMATCCDLAGIDYPKRRDGHAVQPLEGISLRPILKGKEREGHEHLFWEHQGLRAVRSGPWKLVGPRDGEWELYNLDTDRTETDNIADEHPKRVRRLADAYQDWAERVHVFPKHAK